MRQQERRSVGIALLLTLATVAACDDSPGLVTDAEVQRAVPANAIVVSNAADLVGALSPLNAGRRIVVRAGTYAISTPLVVPDGASLEGEGVMEFAGGLPTGFTPASLTAVEMVANVPGPVVTLGDGSSIRGLRIVDLQGRAVANVVAVWSRGPGDDVTASITDTEIVNPNPHGIVFQGPTGTGISALTLNPNLGAPPGPHHDATVRVRVDGTLVRSPNGGVGLFAFNFAERGTVSVRQTGSVVGGGIISNGGVSRPDAVVDAVVRIDSRRNLYLEEAADPCAAPRLGWNLSGGSGPPVPLPVGETSGNTLAMTSLDDRIEGFAMAVLATGARRFFGAPTAGPTSGNSLDLSLIGTAISTPSCGNVGADLRLAGALSGNDTLTPGTDNIVRAVIRGVTGSGARNNYYLDAVGPSGALAPAFQGSGNRLDIVGNAQAFDRTNSGLDPAPGAAQFVGGGS